MESIKITNESIEEVVQIKELTKEEINIEELLIKFNEINDKYIRVCADYANLKRRSSMDRKEASEQAVIHVTKALLPLIDGINAAVDNNKNLENVKIENLIEGITLFRNQLDKFFSDINVQEIGEVGQNYNCKTDEALNTTSTTEYESGQITKVYMKGYTYGDKIIRNSMVEVAK